MSIVSGSPPAAPASMGGLSSAVEDLSVLSEMNSLRFDGSSYLSKTFGSGGDSTKWTYSFWFKKTRLAKDYWDWFFSNPTNAGLMIGYNGANENYQLFGYDGASDNSGYPASSSKMQLRDTGSWYHVVYTKNTTSGARRWRIFVNGVEDINETAETSTVNNNFNTAISHYIGCWYIDGSSNRRLNGYMANIHFIDGQALDADSFGEWISDIWRPRPYTGNYGANGFHLDFAGENMVYDSNGKLTQVLDASSNDNHWTAH